MGVLTIYGYVLILSSVLVGSTASFDLLWLIPVVQLVDMLARSPNSQSVLFFLGTKKEEGTHT